MKQRVNIAHYDELLKGLKLYEKNISLAFEYGVCYKNTYKEINDAKTHLRWMKEIGKMIKGQGGVYAEYEVPDHAGAQSTGRFGHYPSQGDLMTWPKLFRYKLMLSCNLAEIDVHAEEPFILALLSRDGVLLDDYKAGVVYGADVPTRKVRKKLMNKWINGGADEACFAQRYERAARYRRAIMEHTEPSFRLYDGTLEANESLTPTQRVCRVLQATGARVLEKALDNLKEMGVECYGHCHDSIYVQNEDVIRAMEAFKRAFATIDSCAYSLVQLHAQTIEQALSKEMDNVINKSE